MPIIFETEAATSQKVAALIVGRPKTPGFISWQPEVTSDIPFIKCPFKLLLGTMLEASPQRKMVINLMRNRIALIDGTLADQSLDPNDPESRINAICSYNSGRSKRFGSAVARALNLPFIRGERSNGAFRLWRDSERRVSTGVFNVALVEERITDRLFHSIELIKALKGQDIYVPIVFGIVSFGHSEIMPELERSGVQVVTALTTISAIISDPYFGRLTYGDEPIESP